VKEIKTFLRDQTQWTQLFLIAALLVIYIYNFDALPLEKSPIQTIYLQNLFAFLNMGLALFVLTAVTARFAYPAVSLEREAFWMVKAAPLSLRAFLLIKFFIYYMPLLILTEILIVATNLLLKVTPFMMTLSIVTVFFLVPGIVALGIGLGAAYPDFKAENPTQTVTSFGGLVFMMVSAGYIGLVILLQAGPVYRIFMADLHGKPLSAAIWLWIAAAFGATLVLSIMAVILPLRFGEKRLAQIHL
jgi:ABC-2 type transport system permease protein